jgi:hypothetical protein
MPYAPGSAADLIVVPTLVIYGKYNRTTGSGCGAARRRRVNRRGGMVPAGMAASLIPTTERRPSASAARNTMTTPSPVKKPICSTTWVRVPPTGVPAAGAGPGVADDGAESEPRPADRGQPGPEHRHRAAGAGQRDQAADQRAVSAEYQDRYGYPELTDAVKARVLGLNAAELSGWIRGPAGACWPPTC